MNQKPFHYHLLKVIFGLLTLLAIAIAFTVLASCGGSNKASAEEPIPMNLNGEWIGTDSSNDWIFNADGNDLSGARLVDDCFLRGSFVEKLGDVYEGSVRASDCSSFDGDYWALLTHDEGRGVISLVIINFQDAGAFQGSLDGRSHL
jgi:hypothetical protein